MFGKLLCYHGEGFTQLTPGSIGNYTLLHGLLRDAWSVKNMQLISLLQKTKHPRSHGFQRSRNHIFVLRSKTSLHHLNNECQTQCPAPLPPAFANVELSSQSSVPLSSATAVPGSSATAVPAPLAPRHLRGVVVLAGQVPQSQRNLGPQSRRQVAPRTDY